MKPISAWVRECQELIERMKASEDTNERAMLERQLAEKIEANATKSRGEY